MFQSLHCLFHVIVSTRHTSYPVSTDRRQIPEAKRMILMVKFRDQLVLNCGCYVCGLVRTVRAVLVVLGLSKLNVARSFSF
jgi:hypothetical protein